MDAGQGHRCDQRFQRRQIRGRHIGKSIGGQYVIIGTDFDPGAGRLALLKHPPVFPQFFPLLHEPLDLRVDPGLDFRQRQFRFFYKGSQRFIQ